MTKIFLIVGFFLSATPLISLALIAEKPDTSIPYQTIVISAPPSEERVYLGELAGYPDMYEITSQEAFTLAVTIRQLPETKVNQAKPFSLILVRQDDRGGGVSEVARLRQDPRDWQLVNDRLVAMTFLESESVFMPVESGTYRVEISTPDNVGQYWLAIGAKPAAAGYFATLGHIRDVQKHFSIGWWHMLWSTYVLYPLGIVGVLAGMYLTWYNRKKWLHVA